MKTIITLFGLTLFFLLSFAHAQSPRETYGEKTGQNWFTNYYGRTLSSLGTITNIIIIERSHLARQTTTNQMSLAKKIIEHSKIQGHSSISVAGVAPDFTIEYADGLRVRAIRYAAILQLPDGRKCDVWLVPNQP